MQKALAVIYDNYELDQILVNHNIITISELNDNYLYHGWEVIKQSPLGNTAFTLVVIEKEDE